MNKKRELRDLFFSNDLYRHLIASTITVQIVDAARALPSVSMEMAFNVDARLGIGGTLPDETSIPISEKASLNGMHPCMNHNPYLSPFGYKSLLDAGNYTRFGIK